MSQTETPKLTKPDRAAPAAKRVQNPWTSAEQHQCLRPATARARQRELGQVCAAREDCRRWRTSDPSLKPWPLDCNPNPRGTLLDQNSQKVPNAKKPTHVCAYRKAQNWTKEQRGLKVAMMSQKDRGVGGFASPNRQKLSNLEMLRILGVP